MFTANKDNRRYYLLALLTVFYIISVMGSKVLVPLVSNDLGASATQIGFIVAVYSILPLLLVVKIGQWIDKIGYKKPLVISTFTGSIAFLFPFLFPHLFGIYLMQLIAGISQTIFAVSAQSYMGNTGNNNQMRDYNIALFSIAVSIGSFLGPLISGGLSDWLDYGRAFLILSLIGIVGALITFFLKDTYVAKIKDIKQRRTKDAVELLKIKNLRRAFLISAIIMLGKDIYVTYFPLLAQEYGFSNHIIGIIISVNSAAGILIRWIMPILVKKFGRNGMILSSIILSGFIFLIIPLMNSIVMLSVLSFILGMGLGIGQPLSISTTMMSIPGDRVSEGLGLRISVNRFTQVFSPIIFGSLADITGFSTIFLIVGGLLILGSAKTKIEIQEDEIANV